ncbi:MAG: O-antigen ligase family protein [Bacteroidales bacterium]|nr:O-antigen ligase family protein [Bacteroidales bacterium]
MSNARNLFAPLDAWHRVEYALLLVVAGVLPFSWHIAYYVLLAVLLWAIVIAVKERKVGNGNLTLWSKIGFAAMALLPAVYALSLLYTENMAEGKAEVNKILLFAAFPLLMCLFDWKWHKRNHLFGLLQVMATAVVIRFLWRAIVLIKNFSSGAVDVHAFTGVRFDPMHHSYLSMYILLALAYIAYRLLNLKSKQRLSTAKNLQLKTYNLKLTTCLLFASYLLALVADLFLVQSRAGILGFVIMFLGFAIVLIARYKRYLVGSLMIVLLLGSIGATLLLIPNSHNRLLSTVENALSHNYSDDRYAITSVAVNTIKENMPFGVGAGDRIDVLTQKYEAMGAEKLLSHRYNPHNQFLDTLLATGIPGLLILLTVFVSPTIGCLRSRNYLFLTFLLIVVLSALFESIFERQMGITFFCFFFSLMAGSNWKTTNNETIENT